MPDLGPPELIIILLVVVFIFGGSRLAEIGGSLGKGVKEFRNAMNEPEDELPADPASSEPADPSEAQAALGEASSCSICGTANAAGARFCASCGELLVTAGPALEAPATRQA